MFIPGYVQVFEQIELLIQSYGILIPFVLMAVFTGLNSPHFGPLIVILAVVSGLYTVILKIFEFNLDFDLFHFALFARVTGDQGDIITGSVVIFVIGLFTFMLKGSKWGS